MKKIAFFLFLFQALSIFSQEVIIGDTSVKALEEKPYSNWYLERYQSFSSKKGVINELSEYIKNEDFTVEVYFGSWCSDSKREVPKLIKILEEADFDFSNLRLIGVDSDKIVPGISEKERQRLNITNVPTIIVYQDNKEINRFVEYAQESLEEDLLKIFSKKPYKHSYKF